MTALAPLSRQSFRRLFGVLAILLLCPSLWAERSPFGGKEFAVRPPTMQDHARARAALRQCAVNFRVEPPPEVADGWCGSGFVTGGGKWFFTNRHVAGRREMFQEGLSGTRQWVTLTSANGSELSIERYSRDSRWRDISAYRVRRNAPAGVDRIVRFADLQPGEPLWILGNAACQPNSQAQGFIVELWNAEDGPEMRSQLRAWARQFAAFNDVLDRVDYDRLIVTTGFIRPGHSGGPVVDSWGRLAGMAFAGAPQASLIIPIDDLYETIGTGIPETAPKDSFRAALNSAADALAPNATATPEVDLGPADPVTADGLTARVIYAELAALPADTPDRARWEARSREGMILEVAADPVELEQVTAVRGVAATSGEAVFDHPRGPLLRSGHGTALLLLPRVAIPAGMLLELRHEDGFVLTCAPGAIAPAPPPATDAGEKVVLTLTGEE